MEIFKNTLVKQNDESASTIMSGISETRIGPPAEYGGSPDVLNPEEMFVASINSCIMLVFYHFADKFKVKISSYTSDAQGKVEKTKTGLRFTGVQVNARISISDKTQSDKIRNIAELAEQYCLVSNSVSCPVEYKVQVID